MFSCFFAILFSFGSLHYYRLYVSSCLATFYIFYLCFVFITYISPLFYSTSFLSLCSCIFFSSFLTLLFFYICLHVCVSSFILLSRPFHLFCFFFVRSSILIFPLPSFQICASVCVCTCFIFSFHSIFSLHFLMPTSCPHINCLIQTTRVL